MGIFGKLFGALKKTKDGLSTKMRMLFSKNKLGDEFYEELEEILISADVSVATAEKVGLNDEEGFNAGIIRGGMSCQSRLFVAQMQDYLALGKGYRMNTPGTSSGNWQWRMLSGEASKKLAKSIHETTRIYGRL